ncbi:MAG: endonuclease dU, partial [Promethearchaeota archaeon]
MLKRKSCILAFDDGIHEKSDLFHSQTHDHYAISKPKTTSLIGVITKGLQLIHVTRSHIEIDGRDATERILEIFDQNPYRHEIQAILIDSPTMGGFNIPDAFKIHQRTKLPVILIPSNAPTQSIVAVYQSLFPDRENEIEILKKLPLISSI